MKYSKILATCLGSILLLSSTGCDTESPVIKEVFGALSTVKVCKNIKEDNYFNKLDASIDVDLMKNESEAGQLIFNLSKDVKSFKVEKMDLKDGRGHTIPSNDVSVYMQRYLTLTSTPDTTPAFQSGDEIPDFLLPVENAIKCGVNNFEGNNYQGFVVDIKSTSDTVPGDYYGTLTFNFDGMIYEAPINATVWNIEYEGHRNFQTSFLLYKSWLINGEYEDSQELIDSYVDFMTDYKCNTLVVEPNSKIRQEGGMAEYIDHQIELFNNDNNYSSIPLPIISIPETGYDFNTGRIDNLKDRSNANVHQITTLYFYDFIKALLENCTNDINYFPYAYYYLTSFDEMDMYRDEGGLYDRGLKFFAKDGSMDKMINHVVELLKNKGAFSHLTSTRSLEIEKCIKAIPRVVPLTTFDDTIVEDLNLTACPYFSQLDNGLYSPRYVKQREENANGYLWTYTCVGPTYPYPTLHLGDYNLGSRTTGWSCKKNKVNGYLYYAYNIFDAQNNNIDVGFVDPYTSPIRNATCPGDGFLVYPGKRYGSSTPFPSNRLICFRDGMDDYDLLEVFENLLKEKSEFYGVDFDFDEIMSSIYDKVITSVKYVEKDECVYEARKEVMKLISDLKGIDGVFANKELINNKIVTKIYSSSSDLTVDGVKVSPVKSNKGYVYTREDDINKDTKTINVKTPTVNKDVLITKTGYINDFSTSSGITVSEFSKYQVNENICHVTLDKMEYPKNPSKTKMAVRSITLANNNFKNSQSVTIDIKNTSSVPLELNCILISSSNANIGSIYLYPNQTKTFHFGLNRTSESVLGNVKGIMLSCDNYDDKEQQVFDTFTFDINQIEYSL